MSMREISDQVLAMRMLKLREQGGYRYGTFLRMNAKKHIFLFVYFGAALAFFALTNMWFGFALILGMVLGVFFRDLGWVRASGRTWPFTMKVVDWGLVEELAAEQPPA
jgi:fatty acid desaturase